MKLQFGDRVLIIRKVYHSGWLNFVLHAEISVYTYVLDV